MSKQQASREALRTHLKKCSDALLKVRPLGGSELFVRLGDEYFADPDYCGKLIDELRAKVHALQVEKHTHLKPTTPDHPPADRDVAAQFDRAWDAILKCSELDRARARLSIHELRLIIRAAIIGEV